jgi:transcription elongation factor Elf1
MAVQCPFCNAPFKADYPVKTEGVHTVQCDQCRRAFIIWVRKGWLGWSRLVKVR